LVKEGFGLGGFNEELSIIRVGIFSYKFYGNFTPNGTNREVYNQLLTIKVTPHGTDHEVYNKLLTIKVTPHGTDREVYTLNRHLMELTMRCIISF